MNDELLMDLADCGSPEKLLAVILKHHPDWAPPVPVEEFAASVNIVEIKELGVDGFEGALLTDANKQKGAILYKAGTRHERKRWTIGHELGHFLMPSHKGNRQCTANDLRESRRDSDHRRRESEANRFAAGLLMPRPWFVKEMARLGDADVAHVRTLARKFETSLEATCNRYCEITDDICAFVFSQNKIIRYIRPTASFPRLSANAKDTLPNGCASLQTLKLPLRTASAWTELDGSVWLQTERGKKPPAVLEQTMLQSNGFQITLLFIAAENAEDEEETELEQSWEAKFR